LRSVVLIHYAINFNLKIRTTVFPAVVFFILFVNNYCGKRKKNRDLPQKRRLSEPQLIRKASFSMVQDVSLAQSEGKEVEPEQKNDEVEIEDKSN